VSNDENPRAAWVERLPQDRPEKYYLAQLVDSDGGRDDAENAYYEAAADPQPVALERAQRRYRGSYFRRLRRLRSREKHRDDPSHTGDQAHSSSGPSISASLMQPNRDLRRNEMFQHLPFPFDDDEFPHQLGAVVQRTVLDGLEPAREVIHAPDGSWLVGDGVNDPNPGGASIATHIWHAISRNSSIRSLASMPPGHIAQRENPGEPWRVTVLEGWDD
jgi:hypothetical protein